MISIVLTTAFSFIDDSGKMFVAWDEIDVPWPLVMYAAGSHRS